LFLSIKGEKMNSERVLALLVFFFIPVLILVGVGTVLFVAPSISFFDDEAPMRVGIGVTASLMSIACWIYIDEKLRKKQRRIQQEEEKRWKDGERDKCIHLKVCRYSFSYICPTNCRYYNKPARKEN
jgi:hypothetical protein